MISKIIILVVFSFSVIYMAQGNRLPDEAPWLSCEGELNSGATVGGTNVRVYVSGCNSTAMECKLPRGTNQTISTTFLTTSHSASLERVIVAEFPRRIRGVKLEHIPYGAAVDACPFTKKTTDSTSCTNVGVSSNTEYTHASTFPVFANAPKTKLTVKYMLRAPMSGIAARIRRINWKDQSGPYYVCVKIPVELV